MSGRKSVAAQRKTKRPLHAAQETQRFYAWLNNNPELAKVGSRAALFNLARKEGVVSDDFGGRRWQKRKQKENSTKAM